MMYGMERSKVSTFIAAAVLLAGVSAFVAPGWAAHKLNAKQKEVIELWLQHHHGYRLANDADCDCAADIRLVRAGSGGVWKPVPDYHPYIVSGDFNGDGETDFAVVVVSRSRRTHNFKLLVFNGPFESPNVAPAFVDSDLERHRPWIVLWPAPPEALSTAGWKV